MKKPSPHQTRRSVLTASLLATATATALAASTAWGASWGVNSPVSASQRSTAQQVAHAGVPLSALAANAPDEYTVRRGDTLWGISGKFLRSPWRWPELWGMNLDDIRNPHLIYPGQQLYLERVGDRAFLRSSRSVGPAPVVRVSPRNRVEMLDAQPLPTLEPGLIEPFLAEPLVVDDDSFGRAPRIVAMAEKDRVLMARGDRAYARGPEGAPLLHGSENDYRVFRNAVPLIDPQTEEVLGYEAQYVGQAHLVRGETRSEEPWEENTYIPPYIPESGDVNRTFDMAPEDPGPVYLPVPATIDIVLTKEEIQPGDRLLPEPPRTYRSYVPRAPETEVDARVVSVYGNAVRYAGTHQIVAINRGLDDGIASGDVLALQSGGERTVDKTAGRELMQLPDERNGLGMVFLPFDRVSYVLVMDITRPVQVGDKLTNPN
ncbi:MAG: LysM domain-containing protein [Ottowia sp.]|nr:LysM peptidoglycan-binding domain-containing protein [Ottowia sp.]